MNTRRNKGSAAYTPHVEAPSRQSAVSLRGVFGFLLTIALPPVGLLFLWRMGIFRTRGRMFMTVLSTLEMMVLAVVLTPRAELTSQLPVPAAPQSVTAAPMDDNLNALSNIEQLLYEQQLADVIAQGGSARDLLTQEEKLEQTNAENEAVLDTIVYSVYNGAKLYHASRVCGTQTNGRELTLREARGEGLGACPNCNPIVFTG